MICRILAIFCLLRRQCAAGDPSWRINASIPLPDSRHFALFQPFSVCVSSGSAALRRYHLLRHWRRRKKKRHFALLYLSICRRSIAEEFKDAIRRFVCWCTFPRGLNQGPGKCIQDQRATTSKRILLVGSFTLPFDNRTLIPPFIAFLFWRRGVTLAVVFFYRLMLLTEQTICLPFFSAKTCLQLRESRRR